MPRTRKKWKRCDVIRSERRLKWKQEAPDSCVYIHELWVQFCGHWGLWSAFIPNSSLHSERFSIWLRTGEMAKISKIWRKDGSRWNKDYRKSLFIENWIVHLLVLLCGLSVLLFPWISIMLSIFFYYIVHYFEIQNSVKNVFCRLKNAFCTSNSWNSSSIICIDLGYNNHCRLYFLQWELPLLLSVFIRFWCTVPDTVNMVEK